MRAPRRAFVAHRTPTRIRIKLAEARELGADRVSLRELLLEHRDVLAVQLNPLTGSLIIDCRKGFELTARHRQLLGLNIREPMEARSAHRAPGRVPADHEVDGLAGTLILAYLLKAIVAIGTRQIGAQLIEWVVDCVVQTAKSEAQRRAADRKSLLIIPAN